MAGNKNSGNRHQIRRYVRYESMWVRPEQRDLLRAWQARWGVSSQEARRRVLDAGFASLEGEGDGDG